MKKITVSVLFFQFLFLQTGILSAANQNASTQKNQVITSVFSQTEQLRRVQKFPIFTQLSEYTKPRLFSLKKANKAVSQSLHRVPSIFNEKILPVYGFSSYVSARSK